MGPHSRVTSTRSLWSPMRYIPHLLCQVGRGLTSYLDAQVLTGTPPFANQRKPEVAFCVALEDKRPSRPSNSESLGFTHELWNLLELCWAKDARSRPGVCHVVGCLNRVAEHWSADPAAFLLASEAGIQEVTIMEPEKAQKIADGIDKVRRHISGQTIRISTYPPDPGPCWGL